MEQAFWRAPNTRQHAAKFGLNNGHHNYKHLAISPILWQVGVRFLHSQGRLAA